MSEICKLYPTLYEASEEKFIDVANAILKRKSLPTKLQTAKRICLYCHEPVDVKRRT